MTFSTQKSPDASEKLFEKAQKLLPGGVNSPVRAFRGVGGAPRFIASAKGAEMTDVDGKTYFDFIGSWGPMILGHADDEVLNSIRQSLEKGTSYGAPTALEVEMAEEIIDAVPSVEMVRMVNSGTEATMAAIRLARGVTGREKIIKFEGCYHGHGDAFLVKAGSGVATLGLPDSPGVPKHVAEATLTVPFNNIGALEAAFDANFGEVAAVILEPVVGNMGCVIPQNDFLQKVRAACTKNSTLLIFDEVMTGFRLSRGGAQEFFGVKPDITTMGKIIGGGLPVGAYGASREIMRNIAPAGTIYQAGTLSGNPLAMTAGLATLRRLHDRKIYEQLEECGVTLEKGWRAIAAEFGEKVVINRVGSMITMFFTGEEKVFDWTTANTCDREKFGRFFHAMLDEGVYLPPSQFEAAFFGICHTPEIIEKTLDATRRAFEKIAD